MSNSIIIAGKKLAQGCAPFIVAEAGINHNGELEKAFQMIDVAKACGVDAVKFQTFKASEFVADKTQMFTYKSQGKQVTESMLEMFERYEFSKDEWVRIKEYCDQSEITFLSTPQNVTDLELLLELGIDAIKVGSDDFTNLPLLQEYTKTGLPLIVSSGMANMAEIFESLETIGAFDGYPTILLQCTSAYPTPIEQVNLNKMKTLKGAFPNVILGFSDHTQGPLASSLAVSLGAVFFEKHFTLSHDLPGPDHWFSEDPTGLKEWVNSIRVSSTMMGSHLLIPTSSEKEMKKLARRSIVAKKEILIGDTLSLENLTLRRPGTGLEPKLLNKIIHRRAIKNIAKNQVVCMDDFA
jgi:N,N'-diacetyllegionaminate synthase